MKIAEIYLVNLNPTIGHEIKKKRPVVILNGGHEKHLQLAIVVPITTWNPYWKNNPFFVTIEPDSTNGLKKRSVIDCFQIRAISHERFSQKIGELTDKQMEEIKKAIALILDIEPHHCE